MADAGAVARAGQVRARLGLVHDPELDEPVTELGFVTAIRIEGNHVSIGFRLPTYWCAANFAFIMADDMRRAVLALDWVRDVRVRLDDHMYADRINYGLAHGLGFKATFGDDAAGELEELRHTFLLKAFQRRQHALLRHLLARGHAAPEFLHWSIAALDAAPLDDDGARLRARYLARRGVPADDAPSAPAFIDTAGMKLQAATLADYLQALQRVGVNAEFNGALCKGLLAARYGEASPLPDGEPTLLDFIRQPAAPGPSAAA